MAWWYVAAISAIGTAASFKVRNGTGHEILLPGEEEKVDELPRPGERGPSMSPQLAQEEKFKEEAGDSGLGINRAATT